MTIKYVNYLHKILTTIFPASAKYQRAPSIYIEALGLLGLVLYLFNINLQKDLFSTGEIIIALCFIGAWKSWWPHLRLNFLFWLACIWIVSISLSAAVGIYYISHTPLLDQLDESRKMLLYSLFIVVGWWIGPNYIALRNAFLIICLGFIFSSTTWLLDWNYISHLFAGNRIDSNYFMMTLNQFANWSGLLLIGSIFFGRNLIPQIYHHKNTLIKYIQYFISLILVILFLIFIFVTQTRTVWISFIATLIFGSFLYTFFLYNFKFSFKKLFLPVIIASTILTFILTNYDKIVERFETEYTTFNSIITSSPKEVEMTSLGKRMHGYYWFFTEDSSLSPFGWGPYGTKTINESQKLREMHGWPENLNMSHLHNNFLELTMTTGVFGVTIFSFILVFLFKEIFHAYYLRILPTYCLVALTSMLFFFICAGTTTFNIRSPALFPILGGIIFSATLLNHKISILHTQVQSIFTKQLDK